jgi:hypothetical protein
MKKKEIKYVTGLLVIMLAICLLYHLGWLLTVVMLAVTAFSMPFLLRFREERREHLVRFEQCGQYLEQMMYSFQMNGKILLALTETEKVMEEGEWKDRIHKACDIVSLSLSEKNVYEDAFAVIEEKYGNSRMENLHRFFIQVELNGGEYRRYLQLFMEDCSHWIERIGLLRKEVMQMYWKVVAALGIAVGMCAIGDYLLPFQSQGMIAAAGKAVSVLFLLVVIAVYLIVNKRVAIDWLHRDQSKGDKTTEEYVHRLEEYSHEKGHRIGRRILLRTLEQSVKAAFPQWLMQVALLLQKNNVQVSIMQTLPAAAAVMRPDIEKMVKAFEFCPEGILPYEQFLSQYEDKSIRQSMKTLYSISELGFKEGQQQIELLLERNQKMADQADKMKNENTLAGMVALYLLPMLIGAVKLLFDMTLFLFVFFQNIAM